MAPTDLMLTWFIRNGSPLSTVCDGLGQHEQGANDTFELQPSVWGDTVELTITITDHNEVSGLSIDTMGVYGGSVEPARG